jgi:hypothetical protein
VSFIGLGCRLLRILLKDALCVLMTGVDKAMMHHNSKQPGVAASVSRLSDSSSSDSSDSDTSASDSSDSDMS